jgi:hypothetical protein
MSFLIITGIGVYVFIRHFNPVAPRLEQKSRFILAMTSGLIQIPVPCFYLTTAAEPGH